MRCSVAIPVGVHPSQLCIVLFAAFMTAARMIVNLVMCLQEEQQHA